VILSLNISFLSSPRIFEKLKTKVGASLLVILSLNIPFKDYQSSGNVWEVENKSGRSSAGLYKILTSLLCSLGIFEDFKPRVVHHSRGYITSKCCDYKRDLYFVLGCFMRLTTSTVQTWKEEEKTEDIM